MDKTIITVLVGEITFNSFACVNNDIRAVAEDDFIMQLNMWHKVEKAKIAIVKQNSDKETRIVVSSMVLIFLAIFNFL